VLQRVVSRYTREACVRQLERMIGRLARKTAMAFAEGRTEPVTVKAEDMPLMLGPERFFPTWKVIGNPRQRCRKIGGWPSKIGY
jgi:ATP-dependent Lon protease